MSDEELGYINNKEERRNEGRDGGRTGEKEVQDRETFVTKKNRERRMH